MKQKTLSLDMLKQVLKSEENKAGQLRNIANESYQEYQYHNLDHLKTDLLNNLITIAQKQPTKELNFGADFIKQISSYASSLLSFAAEIPSDTFLTLSHRQWHSQSLLLALYLAKVHSSAVLVCCDKQLKGVAHLLVEENEADQLGVVKNIAQKEGIQLSQINSWNTIDLGKDKVVIVDLFDLNPIEYRPFLLSHAKELSKAKQVIFYHSHLQDTQVDSQLSKLEGFQTAVALQVYPEYPIETIAQKQEKAMLQRMITFLKQDSQRPQKQDIVIFMPADNHVRKFSSKIGEQLSKEHMRDKVNIVSKAFQPQPNNKNNIFLVNSAQQLLDWDYNYSHLFYVVDYETETGFRYDYSLGCYVQFVGRCSGIQRAKRMAFTGSSRTGRYVYLSYGVANNLHYLDRATQLSAYILRMVKLGVIQDLECDHPRLAACLELMQRLGIVGKESKQVQILDKQVLEAAQEGVNPIEAKLLYEIIEDSSLQADKKIRLANLMAMLFVLTHTEGNLRQGKQEIQSAAHIKPNGIWRKTGYLESCIQIITKYELIQSRKTRQNSKSQTFRRKTSKINQYEYDVFGSLFQTVEPKKKGFDDMDESELLRQCTVNEDLFLQIKYEFQDIRSALGIEKTPIIFDREDLANVIKRFLARNPHPVAFYSGSRRQGYSISKELPSVFPNKKSLMSQLNERPECALILRLNCCDKRYQILMANAVSSDLYMQIVGKLPARRDQSQSQVEVEFHGISTSTFEELWKNNGEAIVRFETENSCFVEPNQQMAMIMIHCRKELAEAIKINFDAILTKIREKVSMSSKIVNYLGNTNLLLGAGAAVKQLIKSNYIDRCLLNNLHTDVTLEDLQELFEDLFVLKKIELHQPQAGKYSKSAQITFNSQRDYYKFLDCFNEILYYGRLLQVKAIEQKSKASAKAKQYIQFKWFVWRSHKKGLVKFGCVEEATKAFDSFKQLPQLDGSKIEIHQEETELTIDGLNSHTDQIYIQEAMKGFGEIKEVEILKTPLKQIAGEDIYLQSLIKQALAPQNQQQPQQNQAGNQALFVMEAIEKGKNGLRSCRVHMNDLPRMNRVANELNKTTSKLGEGRLYAQTWFEIPVMVPYGSMSIYQEIMRQVFNEAQVTNIKTFILEDQNKTYIILKSPIKQTLDAFHIRLVNSLKGYLVPLSDYEKTIILSQIGLANLLDLEEKYHCKLIVDQIKRTLHTLVANEKRNAIQAEIKARVEDHFFYRLSLNRKAFKHFNTNPNKIQQIRTNYNLRLVELQVDSTSLLLEGSALNVQKAFNYLMHFIESLTVSEEEMINADVCGICCSEPHRPYRLQRCCHKFCRSCLLDYINTVLGDNQMFPIKCPHCFTEVVIDDLECILEANQWIKAQTLATNQYLAAHADSLTFCFTAGCKQINAIMKDHIECDVCLTSYCVECKMRYHPGLTCEQAKNGGDAAFKQYMKENGIRQCPNDKCKIPVIRIDGCYRITCSRCNKSMCFKCEPEKMIAYDNYNDCYKHLNDVHGGYW